MSDTIIPAHQWTNKDGEVLILRFVGHDGKSYGGFQHPMKVGESVTAPDWDSKPTCGSGIHGWPLGLSLGEGKECDWSALWQAYGAKPADITGNLEGGGKCKFRTGTLRFLGDWQSANTFILSAQITWVQQASSGAASSTGDSGAASSTGYSGAASSTGSRGAASSTGDSGAASSTGDSGAASSTGDSGAASSTGSSGAASSTGYSGAASSTGDSGAAVATGINGRAMTGKFGCIALAWWNEKAERSEMRVSKVGQGPRSLKPNVWYTLDNAGKFVEVK